MFWFPNIAPLARMAVSWAYKYISTDMRSKISKMKSTPDGIKNRSAIVEEKISELESTAIKITK